MIAVCNTSPISSLIQIGALSLLERLFDGVYVPPEVVAELEEGADIFGDWRVAPGASIVQIRTITNKLLFRELSADLHPGEAAAITLAAETAGAVLLIDEADGRRAAARLGVRITGTVGILVAAKGRGHVQLVAPLLEDLRAKAHFWISDDIIRRACELAGEA
jgi:predicted nucleic acid-binding protein